MTTKPTISKDNEFLLPDDLGWDCNDELAALVKSKFTKLSDIPKAELDGLLVEVWIAELLDDIYAVIKKYQAVHTGGSDDQNN